MTYTYHGACSNEYIGDYDPLTMRMLSSVPAPRLVLVAEGGDTASVNLSSVTDDKSNTYDWSWVSSSSGGNVLLAWSQVTASLTSTDDVVVNYDRSNDVMAQVHSFSGLGEDEITKGTKAYTESTTFSITLNPSQSGLMIALFTFPYDYFTATPSGWTRFVDIRDGTDQQLLGYYKAVSAGSNTCSYNLGSVVAYLASAVVLPYVTSTTPAPGTTTPPPGSAILHSRVIGLWG
jgi:hypothetical protein